MATYSKKMQSTLMREKKKIFRNLNGIRNMNRMPEAVIVVDPGKEKNCVQEARNVGPRSSPSSIPIRTPTWSTCRSLETMTVSVPFG